MPRNRARRMQRDAKTNAKRWFRPTRPRNRGHEAGHPTYRGFCALKRRHRLEAHRFCVALRSFSTVLSPLEKSDILRQREAPDSPPGEFPLFIDPSPFFRHRVKPELAQGVAAQQPPDRQDQSFDQPMDGQGLHGVFAAGGHKPAMMPQMGADEPLVPLQQRNEQPGHGADSGVTGATGAALARSGRPALAKSLPSVLLSWVLFRWGV